MDPVVSRIVRQKYGTPASETPQTTMSPGLAWSNVEEIISNLPVEEIVRLRESLINLSDENSPVYQVLAEQLGDI